MSKPHLIAIDDDEKFAHHVTQIATGLGFSTVAATEGHEFMVSCTASPPDVIVLELVLQDIDGFDLIRWLIGEDCGAQLIVISAYSHSYVRAAEVLVRQHGKMSVTFLSKPVKDRDLRAALTAAYQKATSG